MSDKKTTYLNLTITILLWSAAPAFAKIALSELDNSNLLFYTTIISVISLFGILFAQGKAKLLTNYKLRDYLIMSGMGLLGFYLYNLFLFKGFSIAPAGQANVVNYLYPVFMVIFSVLLLKEKSNLWTFIAIAISFTGALIAITGGNLDFANQYAEGYIYAGLAAVTMGLFSVFIKRIQYETFSSLFVYAVAALVLVVPTIWFTSVIILPTSISVIVDTVVLGVFMNSLAYVFWFRALKVGNIHWIANLMYVVPFLAMVFTFFLNDEAISPFSVVGLGLIIMGIILHVYFKNSARTERLNG
ncbi:MAG: DMT family transporter [Candidatus Bathyarchaeia archaeon]|jgi:drug/metabolite transporter (DMT)-like permease